MASLSQLARGESPRGVSSAARFGNPAPRTLRAHHNKNDDRHDVPVHAAFPKLEDAAAANGREAVAGPCSSLNLCSSTSVRPCACREFGGEQRIALGFVDRHAGVGFRRDAGRDMADANRPNALAVLVGAQAPAFALLYLDAAVGGSLYMRPLVTKHSARELRPGRRGQCVKELDLRLAALSSKRR